MPELTTPNATLRHVLVTLADRFEHAVDGAAPDFGEFDAGADVRPPTDIVRHLTSLMRFAEALWTGTETVPVDPLPWDGEIERLRREVRALDATLRRVEAPTGTMPAHRVLQGPLLDAVTHVGQLTTLRRLAGAPVGRRRYVVVDMQELAAD